MVAREWARDWARVLARALEKERARGEACPPPAAPISPAQTDALVARAAPAESIDSVVRKNRKLGQETRKQFMTFPDGTSDHDQEDARAMVVASTFAERTALKDPVMSALAASVIPVDVLHRENTEDVSARLAP